jgi:hypothetical protein
MASIFSIFGGDVGVWIASAVALTAIAAAYLLARRMGVRNARLATALDNMSQGLCMFDAGGRILVFNARYLDMYGLSAGEVRPGCDLRDLIRWRIAAGTFAGDGDEYVTTTLREISEGAASDKIIDLPNGRTVALSNRPMAGGGWVCTHDDITDQRAAQARDASAAEELLGSIVEIGRQLDQAADVVRSAVAETHSTDTGIAGLAQAAANNAQYTFEKKKPPPAPL